MSKNLDCSNSERLSNLYRLIRDWGWGGAAYGAQLFGEMGATYGAAAGPYGIAIGGLGGSFMGGIGGYYLGGGLSQWAASWLTR